MIIDMHNHTAVSSFDSCLLAEELIELAREKGLDGICVTEHSFLEGAEVAKEIGKKLRFPVFRGIEARTDLGDMMLFGYYRDVPDGIPFPELTRRVHEAGGVVFAAHPFRLMGFTLQSSLRDLGLNLDDPWQCMEVLEGLDGIETSNGRSTPEMNGRAGSLAYRMGMPGIGGSDAHSPEEVGRFVTHFSRTIRSEKDLVRALRAGKSNTLPAPIFSGKFLPMGMWESRSAPDMGSNLPGPPQAAEAP